MAGFFTQHLDPNVNPASLTTRDYSAPNTYDAHTMGLTGGGLYGEAGQAGPLVPNSGIPPGAQPTPGGGWVTYGPNGEVTGGGGPAGASGGGAATGGGGNPTDKGYVTQQVLDTAKKMQAAGQYVNPSVLNDPGYWADRIIEKGGWVNGGPGKDNIGFFSDLFTKPEGARQDGGQQQGGSLGSVFGGGVAGGMGGDLLQPYTGTFSAPTGTDDPGFQFALQQGQQGIERSAAAKGTLLTGGTLKDLASYTTGAALQNYDQAYNRSLNTFKTNYDIFRNNQNDPFNKLYSTSGLGLNAANQYSGTLGQNTSFYSEATNPSTTQGLGLNQGNINAQGALNQGNTLQNYAAIGTNLANSFFNRPRNTGLSA